MDPYSQEKQGEEPRGTAVLLTLSSALVGGGALGYAWLRYQGLVHDPNPNFYGYQGVQLAFLALMGFLCLWATFLFMAGKASAVTVFKTGLSVLPVLLFTNLLMLIFRVIQSALQGNAATFISRLYVSPLNQVILTVAITLLLLSVAKGIKK